MERAADSGRVAWIDVAKGIGILLVVLGHISTEPGARAVFLFHMPLFFMLAGATFRRRNLLDFARARAASILVPYAAYLALVASTFPADWRSLVVGGTALQGPFAPFWFATCLFAALMLRNALGQLAGDRRAVTWAAAGASACLALALPPKVPLGLAVAPMALAFIVLGEECRRWAGSRGWRLAVGAAAATTAAYVAALACGWLEPFAVDMKHAAYGPPLVGALVSGAAALLVVALSKAATTLAAVSAALGHLGRASLAIMFLHMPVHHALKAVATLPWWWSALAAVALPLAFDALARRWEPTRRAFLGAS